MLSPEFNPPVGPDVSESGHAQTELLMARPVQALYDQLTDISFAYQLRKYGLGPDDTEKPEYWRAFAESASIKANESLATTNKRSPSDVLHELLCSVPDLCYAQTYLDSWGSKTSADIKDATLRCARFNGIVQEFATVYPDVRFSSLVSAMTHIASQSIEQKSIVEKTAEIARLKCVGIRNELGFGQFMHFAGVAYRPATPEEDLRGVDIIIFGKDRNQDLRLDIKSNLGGGR